IGAGGGAAWAVPEASPSMDTATPPAASAPVHRRSHGLVCVLIFMPLQFPVRMCAKPTSIVSVGPQIVLLTETYLGLRALPSTPDHVYAGQLEREQFQQASSF